MHRPPALLLIDLQNDFLVEGGAFSKRHVDPSTFSQNVAWLVEAWRQQGRPLVWVTSVYGECRGADETLQGQTHLGSRCCVRGSWGAQLVDVLAPLVLPADLRLEKGWYSAFRDSTLHETLQAAGVERLVLAGVATNVCVLATARDALRLGYQVDVVSDATTASTISKHRAALREMVSLGCRSRRWGELLGDAGPVRLRGLGGGGTELLCGALDDCIDEGTFAVLEKEIAWSRMLHRGGEVPRLVAVQGELGPDGEEPLYRHPADGQPELRPFTETVDAIRRRVEVLVGHPLNHGLLQLYRDGRDWISEHSDKTLDLVRPSCIVNVSIGRMRTMVLRPKSSPEGAAIVQKIPLPHGSVLCMDLDTNRRFYHAIKQAKDPAEEGDDGPRISFTFRCIGSWLDRRSGAVWGVGAPSPDRQRALERLRGRSADGQVDREHERAEAERLLVLFRQENVDPAFDAGSYAPGFEVLDFEVLNREPTPQVPREAP